MSMYPFPPAPDVACGECNFAYWEKAFNDEEISRIIQIGEKNHGLDKAQVFGGNTPDSIRKSKVSWIGLNDESQFIYDRLRDIAVYMNGKHFQFDLYGFVEHLQYTVYDGDGSHYTWHIDKGQPDVSPRKLTLVVQLSDPSEYEGGNLNFMTGENHDVGKKQKGLLYAFPSYLLHRVTPVTSGVRRSLVVWLSGPKFR